MTTEGGKVWRRGWDSNPRYACTHNGFRDRPDRPLWHLSGATLIGGCFRAGNSVGEAGKKRRISGFPALTWALPCVYSALLQGLSGPTRSFMISGIWDPVRA